MEMIEYTEDRVWEAVLTALSDGGRLSKLYKTPQHELTALLKVYGKNASNDLSRVFVLTQFGRLDERNEFLGWAGEGRILAMLHTLVRCMKCWVETDSPVQTVRRRWKIAHS